MSVLNYLDMLRCHVFVFNWMMGKLDWGGVSSAGGNK